MSEGTMKNKDNQKLVLTEGMMHKYARLNLLQTGMAAAVLFMAADSGLYAAEDAGAAAQKSPAVKEASPEVSPEEVARSRSETIGREIVTREADESLADSYALDAAKAYEAGNYDESVTAYLKAIEILTKLGDLPRFQEKIESCKVAISKAYYYWSLRIYYEAQDSAKAGNYDLAIENCRKAMELYPPCKSRMEEAIAKYTKMKDALKYREDVATAVADADREERLYNIELLLAQGEAFYRDGQLDLARDKFDEVLAINPYNAKAMENLRKVQLKLYQAGKLRTAVTRAERLAEVAWNSIPPIIAETDLPDSDGNEIVVKESENTSDIARKLENIMIDHIEFEDVSIGTVAKYLKQRSKEKDPEKIGVNIVLRLENPELANRQLNKDQGGRNTPFGDDSGFGDDFGDDMDMTVLEETEVFSDDSSSEMSNASLNPSVTMVVDDISLGDAIRYICRSANLKYRIEKYAVVIAGENVPLEDVETKIYPIEREALELLGAESDQEAVKKYFTDRGIQFPAGAKIVYDDKISRLIVTNTPEALAKIDIIIKEMNVVDPQVLVMVKFVEIGMNDLEELGFEYMVSRPSNTDQGTPMTQLFPTTDPVMATESFYLVERTYTENQIGGISTYEPKDTVTEEPVRKGQLYMIPTSSDSMTEYYALSTRPVNGKSVIWGPNDALVRSVGTDPLAYGYEGTMKDTVSSWSYANKNGYKINAKINALDQAESTDILSAPRITTMNGSEAVIRMVTEKYYPDSWGDAELGEMTSDNENVPIFTPSIPEFGDATEEGIVLRVVPYVDADKYTISLQMNPVIQNMVGWTDYSYQIPLGDNGDLYPNTLKMPIIEARTVDTQVSCYDGETIVLGGVIRDKISEVDDSYPILGDIPLIGRLFQSKGKGSNKTSLLIFLTCKLVNPDGSPLRERETRSIPPFTR